MLKSQSALVVLVLCGVLLYWFLADSPSQELSPVMPPPPLIASPTPTPTLPVSPACVMQNTTTRIHFPLSVTSNKMPYVPRRVQDLPLLRFALPSIIATVEPDRFGYGVTLGIDRGDEWYDNTARQADIRAWW